MPAAVQSDQQQPKRPAARPRVLIVDDEPDLVDIVGHVVRDEMGCRIVTASSVEQARHVLAAQSVELLVTDVHLPDGSGMALLPELRQRHPTAGAIVITGSPSLDGVINAMRGGAIDFVPKPFTPTVLLERVRGALARQALAAREEVRFRKLKEAVKRLNASRKLISKKVDLLCNDLVSAYGELSRQLDGVRTQEGFRKYIANAKDLEQLLCHAMDWLLRQLGYANVAVWLTGEDGEFQLGAYMKYTVAGEPMLVDAIKRVLLPVAVRDGAIHLKGDELSDKLTPQELHYLKGQDVVAVNCTYLGESLAAVVFFRDAKAPFSQDDDALLKTISPIFAVALASVVRDAKADDDEDGETPFSEGESSAGGGGGGAPESDEKNNKKKRDKSSDADWWKRGEPPPF
jgi:response regulator of citrate/malate metabolism